MGLSPFSPIGRRVLHIRVFSPISSYTLHSRTDKQQRSSNFVEKSPRSKMMLSAMGLTCITTPQLSALGGGVWNAGGFSQKPTGAALQGIFIRKNSHDRLSSSRILAKPSDQDTVSYEGERSVFPAEACEELGGEFCGAEGVGEEVKASAIAKATASLASNSSGPDREYEEYKGNKTVFPGEACDTLGEEFCGPEYQKDVFPEKQAAN